MELKSVFLGRGGGNIWAELEAQLMLLCMEKNQIKQF